MGRGKLGLAVLSLLIAAVAVAFILRQKSVTDAARANVDLPTSPGGNPDTLNSEASRPPASESAAQETPTAAASADAGGDPQFRSWIAEEAKSLDHPRVNREEKQEEIARVVSRLTRAQSRELLKAARNAKGPASEKILSTFLLVEGGVRSLPELSEFISSPLADAGPHEVHSVEEVQGVREKSLRIMAIDGLFSRAQSDAQARKALARAAEETQDPFIKSYARDKLNQL